MWIGKPLRYWGDLFTVLAAVAVLVSMALHQFRDRQTSCERAEAVNEAYMKGFRAGQIDGVQQCVERVEQWNEERSKNDSTRQL